MTRKAEDHESDDIFCKVTSMEFGNYQLTVAYSKKLFYQCLFTLISHFVRKGPHCGTEFSITIKQKLNYQFVFW